MRSKSSELIGAALMLVVGLFGRVEAQTIDHSPAQLTESAKALDSLLGLDSELDKLLMNELQLLGYDQTEMAKQAVAIEAMPEDDKRKAVIAAFYAHYEKLALTGLQQLVDKAGNPAEALKMLADVETVLKNKPVRPQALPVGISFVYDYIEMSAGVATVLTNPSPCLTWRIRLGCMLALLTDKECAYTGDINISERHLMQDRNVESTFPSGEGRPNSSYLTRGVWERDMHGSSVLRVTSRLSDFRRPDAQEESPSRFDGFIWPLGRGDHKMCVEAKDFRVTFDGRADLAAGEGLSGYSGYIWNLTLASSSGSVIVRDDEGAPFETPTWLSQHIMPCREGFTVGIKESPDRIRSMSRERIGEMKCWYSDLNGLIGRGAAYRPAQPGDSDAIDAVSISIGYTSTLITKMMGSVVSPSNTTHAALNYEASGLGVLVLRDRR
jgi:hypothetical protein